MYKSMAQIRQRSGETFHLFFDEVLWSSKQHVVYDGRIQGLADPIVIKIPLTDEIITVHKEASILHRLHGIMGIPQYVGLYTLESAGEYTGKQALLVKKISGQDIEQRRKSLGSALPEWREARDLLMEVAQTMSQIHDRGIAHCDLKLRNLMRKEEQDGHIIVLDWDNSVDYLHSDGRKEGPIVGTVQYMSYEQVTGQQLDQRTDIYSLGAAVALFAYGPAICQRYTIDDDGTIRERTSHETADAIAGGERIKYDHMTVPLSIAEQRFQTTLEKMTRHNKTQRHQSMYEVIADLKDTYDS